jgi:hypothetical protein
MSNGMSRKARERRHKIKWTEDGLPRDAQDWTIEDWADLYYGLEAIKRKIAARHAEEREGKK